MKLHGTGARRFKYDNIIFGRNLCNFKLLGFTYVHNIGTIHRVSDKRKYEQL